eukprot:CAMPEP_0115749546 /NCGR_PEP_ID=MMETSP0272-20121206/94246_1 /TAXON_ID=71861 /ORGANISM="Scrippsiella trochoidea, Strain CCMP3099" /LENGTH=172 /DNA_ID=CAMNT_0003194597 /DNA_START=100 /DNA_END=618 /DNA_ORIENTATION=-
MELLSKSFYTSHLNAIKHLVEEPAFAKPSPAEPVLEIVIANAELWKLPEETEASLGPRQLFVRLWMDGELVGETSIMISTSSGHEPYRPAWNERLLVMPRGSVVSRFELCIGREQTHVRGHCAFGSEGLWQSAVSTGRLDLEAPLLHEQSQVGILRLHVKMWDGLPVQTSQA